MEMDWNANVLSLPCIGLRIEFPDYAGAINMKIRWLIQLFGYGLRPVVHPFQAALKQPEVAQRKLQRQIFRQFLASDYGQALQKHRGIDAMADWQKIPVITYEEIRDGIEGDRPLSLQSIHHSHLTKEAVVCYERTSGSSGAVKWIPYTRSLLSSFNLMFCYWAWDLITHGPRLQTGRLYFCISPQLQHSQDSQPTDRPLANALQDDSDYLAPLLKALLRPFWVGLAVPRRVQRVEVFQHALAIALLEAPLLEIISVWSPSFLQVQLDYIRDHREALIHQARLTPARVQILQQEQIAWTELWPHLKLVSCWASHHSHAGARQLQGQFPGVWIQGKGLLATEAPLTLPWIQAGGAVPLVNQVFFEFEPEVGFEPEPEVGFEPGAEPGFEPGFGPECEPPLPSGQMLLLHQVQVGRCYRVVISQRGGLYRYCLGDRVRVTHFYHGTPCLEFVGRSGSTSDLVGEKLQEAFVQSCFAQAGLDVAIAGLIPQLLPQPHYHLLLDGEWLRRDLRDPGAIAAELEQALRRNPHYAWARELGQLRSLQVQGVERLAVSLAARSSARWGDFKYRALYPNLVEPTA
jgi:hypothetical protein